MKIFARILLAIIFITIAMTMLFSCSDGKIPVPEKSPVTVIWGKKKYSLVKIYPDSPSKSYPIWIMYPQDTTTQIPINLNYIQSNGKSSYNQTVVILP